MNNKRYFQLIFLLVAFLASLLVACSSTAPTEMPDTDVVTANELPAEEIAEISVEALGEPQPDANPDPSQEGNGNTPGDPGQLSVVPAVSRMVIKDAEMELLVADTDLSMPEVVQLAGDYEGYIITSKTWFEDEYKYASIQLGIPVDHFETVLNRLRSLGLQVVRETASGQDVTGEYVDLQSRLTNLEATAD
ncbi:MAG: DUF4349 domain-containing protein, partial [Gammaproteobacteria bacterium]|nr:DUF4349 domain-containing protein [Gammaproteobacteria bacterium]